MDAKELKASILKIISWRADEHRGRPCTLKFIFSRFGIWGFEIRPGKHALKQKIISTIQELLNERKISKHAIKHELIRAYKAEGSETTETRKAFFITGYVPSGFNLKKHSCEKGTQMHRTAFTIRFKNRHYFDREDYF